MKTALTLFVALSFGLAFGQTTIIPDPAFEQRLIDLGLDTGTPDGSVPTTNINTITSLDVSNDTIKDLTGIQAFTAIKYLNCSFNSLDTLDVSQNIVLTTTCAKQIYNCFAIKNYPFFIIFITLTFRFKEIFST